MCGSRFKAPTSAVALFQDWLPGHAAMRPYRTPYLEGSTLVLHSNISIFKQLTIVKQESPILPFAVDPTNDVARLALLKPRDFRDLK